MKIHIARAGESLWQLAQKYNVPIERLREANPTLQGGIELNAGDKIRIPTGKVPLIASRQNRHPAPAQEPKTVMEQQPDREADQTFSSLPYPPQLPELPEIEGYHWDSSSSSSWEAAYYEETPYPMSYPPPMPPYPAFIHGYWPVYPPSIPAFYASAYDPYMAMPAPIDPAAYPMIQGGWQEEQGVDQEYTTYTPYPVPSTPQHPPTEDWTPPGYWQPPQMPQTELARLKESSSTLA